MRNDEAILADRLHQGAQQERDFDHLTDLFREHNPGWDPSFAQMLMEAVHGPCWENARFRFHYIDLLT